MSTEGWPWLYFWTQADRAASVWNICSLMVKGENEDGRAYANSQNFQPKVTSDNAVHISLP